MADGRISTVQSVGGGNALFLGAMLYKESCDGVEPRLLLSENSWVNHPKIFGRLRYDISTVADFSRKTREFNGEAFLESVDALSAPTLILLQASCGNPTGNVASKEWWSTLKDLVLRKIDSGVDLTVFFDAAYQGFGKGLQEDVAPVRLFVDAGIPVMTAWSGSKNFGLYGARVGALSVATQSSAEKALVHTNLCEIVRSVQSNCPRDGAELVGDVLSNPMLITVWNQELARLRSELKSRRELVASALESHIPGFDTRFIRNGEGFFSHFGLTDSQSASLKEAGIYLPMKGRVAYPLFRSGNVDYFARALKKALSMGERPLH
jgi:aromatic-amino-acid transaminase